MTRLTRTARSYREPVTAKGRYYPLPLAPGWRRRYVPGMRTKISVLFAVLSIVVVGACGGDSDNVDATTGDDSTESLTKEEFIERGDAVCAELDVALTLVESPQDESDYARYLKEILPSAESAREVWALLDPPTDGEDVHQAMLDQLDNGIENVEGAIAAAESGDTVTAGDLLAEADREGDLVDAQAKAYGFRECGADNVDKKKSNESTPDDQPLPEEEDPAPVDSTEPAYG